MPDLYPFLMRPQFYERPWGARDLAPIYDKKADANPIGEVWLTGEACTIANGALAGTTLAEAAKQFGVGLVGEAAPRSDRFPLLIKFLFPREKLSVQVHPDDAMARRLGEANGKTECWYVLAAEPGAQVGLGVKPGTTREEMERAVAETRAEHLLNWIDVRPGELIYVDAGTVHAIGPGSVLVETQQNSDTTYRLYDYGRPRPLHVQRALEAMKPRTHAGKAVATAGNNGHVTLVASPCFVVEKFPVAGTERIARAADAPSSAQVLVALAGEAMVTAPGAAAVRFLRGEAVVVPAAVREFTVTPAGSAGAELLRATLPEHEVPQPKTTL